MKILILDLETTGLAPKGANYKDDFMVFPYILSMGWKVIEDGAESPTYEYVINQEGRIIPPEATKINGITQAMCDASKMNTFTVLLQFMMDACNNDFIVGHNLYFDTSTIKANILRIIEVGKKTPMDMFIQMSAILDKEKRIDTMRICAKLWGSKWPTLGEAYTKLFGEIFKGHSAGADVQACCRIFQELMRLNAIRLVVPDKINKEILGTVLTEEE